MKFFFGQSVKAFFYLILTLTLSSTTAHKMNAGAMHLRKGGKMPKALYVVYLWLFDFNDLVLLLLFMLLDGLEARDAGLDPLKLSRVFTRSRSKGLAS